MAHLDGSMEELLARPDMHTKTLRWLFISLLLVALPVVMGTKGWKKTNTGASGSGGIAGLAKTCRYIENPADGEEYETLLGHFFVDVTAISMWCRTEGGTDVDITLYEHVSAASKPTITTGAEITCVNDTDAGVTDNFTNVTIDAGNEIGLKIVDVDGSVTTLNVCVEFE